jgi:hypothetical protein
LLDETPLHYTKPTTACLRFLPSLFVISRGYFAVAQHVVMYDEDVLCIFPLSVI